MQRPFFVVIIVVIVCHWFCSSGDWGTIVNFGVILFFFGPSLSHHWIIVYFIGLCILPALFCKKEWVCAAAMTGNCIDTVMASVQTSSLAIWWARIKWGWKSQICIISTYCSVLLQLWLCSLCVGASEWDLSNLSVCVSSTILPRGTFFFFFCRLSQSINCWPLNHTPVLAVVKGGDALLGTNGCMKSTFSRCLPLFVGLCSERAGSK